MNCRPIYNLLIRTSVNTRSFSTDLYSNGVAFSLVAEKSIASVNHVARRALSGGKFTCRVGEVVTEWTKLFTNASVDEPRPSIENIVAHVLNSRRISDVYIFRNKLLTNDELRLIVSMCRMRLHRMPIQYILGEWDFRNLTLKMRPPVFIPRPETEMLVEIISNEISDTSSALELCCGCGAISLALLSMNPNLIMTAIDKSAEACNLTDENAKNHGFSGRLKVLRKEICESDVNNFLEGKFDLIVSNAPYIPSGQLKNIQPEILMYEDLDALDGGKDGLRLIKLILKISSKLLNKNGKLFLEVDPTHPALVKSWLQDNDDLGLSVLNVFKDFSEHDRFIQIVK